MTTSSSSSYDHHYHCCIILIFTHIIKRVVLLLAELGGPDHGLGLDPGVEGGDALEDAVRLLIPLPLELLLGHFLHIKNNCVKYILCQSCVLHVKAELTMLFTSVVCYYAAKSYIKSELLVALKFQAN